MSATLSGRSVSWRDHGVRPEGLDRLRQGPGVEDVADHGSAPRSRSHPAFSGDRVYARHFMAGLATSSGTRRTPIRPLAPATKMRTAQQLRT